jgi:hypothetical protein
MTKIQEIRDADGNVVNTVTTKRSHGFAKFVGVFFGIGFAVEVFASGNVIGILSFIAVVVMTIVGLAIRSSNREKESE